MSPDIIGKSLALICAVAWAGAVVFFKRSGETMPPLALNLFKSTVACLVILPLWALFDQPMIPETLSMKELGYLALSGLVGITLADTLVLTCLNTLGAGYYAIIDCVYSPMMIFFSWLLLSEPLTQAHIWGSLFVITGVMVITTEKTFKTDLEWKRILKGSTSGIVAIGLMVISIIGVKPILDNHSPLMVAQCRMIPAAIALHLITLFQKNRLDIYKSITGRRAFKLALPGAILGNVISILAWITAFKYTDMGSASVLNQTNVILVVVLAWLFLGESLSYRKLAATILGFVGAVIILSGCHLG